MGKRRTGIIAHSQKSLLAFRAGKGKQLRVSGEGRCLPECAPPLFDPVILCETPTMLQDQLEKLPPALRKEALDYIEFLLKKHRPRSARKPMRFDWAGCLSHLKDTYTSVELQHKIADKIEYP